jgi:hypothetical protein
VLAKRGIGKRGSRLGSGDNEHDEIARRKQELTNSMIVQAICFKTRRRNDDRHWPIGSSTDQEIRNEEATIISVIPASPDPSQPIKNSCQ